MGFFNKLSNIYLYTLSYVSTCLLMRRILMQTNGLHTGDYTSPKKKKKRRDKHTETLAESKAD